MVLKVAIEDFVEAAKRYAQSDEAFVSAGQSGTVVSSVDASKQVIVSSVSELPVGAIRGKLEAGGLKVREGEWSRDAAEEDCTDLFVAAVAYRSRETTPGLWVDAYKRLPNTMDVLRAMYEEFVRTGEATPASFEQFMESAQPNVQILEPHELQTFANDKGH